MKNYIQILQDSFELVHKSVHPNICIKSYIPSVSHEGKIIIVGAGKASAAMAQAFESEYDGDVRGVVVTRYGHSVTTSNIKIIEAAHPVPDESGVKAVAEIIAMLETATAQDTIICLISGGGSSLLTAPVAGIKFEDLQKLNEQLLKSGAPIQDINTVRKHLNKVLGGGLAQYAPLSRFTTLAISDVVGDDPSIIASGATVADPSTLIDSRSILKRYNINVDVSITQALNNPDNETPKSNDPLFKRHEYHLIATPMDALNTAKNFWEDQGFNSYIWNAEMQGDTNDCAKDHINFIEKIYKGNLDIKLPCALLSGGETTVTVNGTGDGGPNTQFMLQAAILLNGHPKIYAMACDTDGIDGNMDSAGAVITPETFALANEKGINPQFFLDNNDSYNFFARLGCLIKTGPTYTNVNDYRVFLLLP